MHLLLSTAASDVHVFINKCIARKFHLTHQAIMVNTVFSQEIRSHRRHSFYQDIYEVYVYGEENEFASFEIMADSASEATAEAERLVSDEFVNIAYITVNNMSFTH